MFVNLIYNNKRTNTYGVYLYNSLNNNKKRETVQFLFKNIYLKKNYNKNLVPKI